jgi:benzoylformate decarboxylase
VSPPAVRSSSAGNEQQVRPGLGIASLARGWGCHAVDVETTEELEQEFKPALGAGTTTVIVVRTQPQKAML